VLADIATRTDLPWPRRAAPAVQIARRPAIFATAAGQAAPDIVPLSRAVKEFAYLTDSASNGKQNSLENDGKLIESASHGYWTTKALRTVRPN
jgi:hypothetical protein